MTGNSPTSDASIGAALGRIPSGLFVVTTTDERGEPMGFVGSFVQQMSLSPPTVAVAIGTDRDLLAAVRASGRFGINVLGAGDRALMKPFFREHEEGTPFDEVAHSIGADGGCPRLDDALAWVDCRVAGEHRAGDHVVVFGIVERGSRASDGDPMIHTRRNGLRYS